MGKSTLEYMRKYRAKNREKINAYGRKFYKENIEEYRQRHRKYYELNIDSHKERNHKNYLKNKDIVRTRSEQFWKRNPLKKRLFVVLSAIRQRCTNPLSKAYRRYGARGIKNFLTLENMIFLWKRDKANRLKKPSIDRIDNDGNYDLSNCRFIEFSENASKGNRPIVQLKV